MYTYHTMSWDLTNKEYRRALAMSPADRYAYTLQKVTDWEELWLLDVDGTPVCGSDRNGRPAMPIWPHRRFAEDCGQGAWADAKPRRVGLGLWMSKCIARCADDGCNIAVFDTRKGDAVFLKPKEHLADLRKELRRSQ